MIALAAAFLAAAPVPTAPDPWRLVWSDEFDGKAIDRSKWTVVRDCWGGGNNERQCYVDRPANAQVADGVLTITAKREKVTGSSLPFDAKVPPDGAPTKTQEYSSAKLVTKGKAAWRYGRFAIRARLPHGQGTWPAIWMMPQDDRYGKWAASGEIDIMEVVNLGAPCTTCAGGIENRLLGTLHFGGQPPSNRMKGDESERPVMLDGAFHTYELTWTPDEMVWRIDGSEYARRRVGEWSTTASRDPRAPFDQPFYMILNLAVGGGLAEGRNLKTVDPAAFPARFDIDYVRVWQCDEGASSSACGGTQGGHGS